MRYISSAEIRSNPALLWKEGEGSETIITVNGKPKVIALSFSGDPEELMSLIRRLRAEKAIESIWASSEEKKTDRMKLEDIESEISAARTENQNARANNS